MAVADLYNVPKTPQDFHSWSFAHMAHHRAEVEAIFARTGIQLPIYVLDPVDLENPGVFMYQHQQMHNAIDALTGVDGYDLTDVNLQEDREFSGWIFLNAQLHYNEATVLGVW